MVRPPSRIVALVGAVAVVLALAAAPASAQSVDAAIDDLRGQDVTFEEGAEGLGQLQEVADAAASLSVPGAFYKVVLLATPVETTDDERLFAQLVLDGLDGTGRVQVNSPAGVGIASNVDLLGEVEVAEQAAEDAVEQFDDVASVYAAGDVLGAADPSLAEPSSSSSSDDSGGGGGGIVILLVVAVLVVGGIVFFLWFVSRNKKAKGDGTPSTTVDLAAQKVRAEVDTAANLVIELNDAQSLPGFTDEAKTWFRQGATLFADLQDDLEEADTRPELEAVWPKLKECTWKLAGAKALVAGEPAPAQPPVEPLIPQTTVFGTEPTAPGGPVVLGGSLPPPSAPLPPPPPAAHYRQPTQSPWLSQAAMVAMSMLAAQGIGNATRTRSGRDRRPPSNDDWFGSVFGGGGGGGSRSSSSSRSSRRSSGSSRSGRVGKGMGRRR